MKREGFLDLPGRIDEPLADGLFAVEAAGAVRAVEVDEAEDAANAAEVPGPVAVSIGAALRELLRFPRIVGWQDPVTNGELFLHLGQLVRSVPVLRLQVPWQERLDLSLGEDIRELLLDAARQ